LQREAARTVSRRILESITGALDGPSKTLAREASTPLGAWIEAALVGHAERFVRLHRNLDEQLDAATGKAKLKARVCFDAGAMKLRLEQRLAFLDPPARPKLVILGTDESITGLLERSLKALGYESVSTEVLKGKPGKRGPSARHKKRARKLLESAAAQTAIIAIVRDTGAGLDTRLQQNLEIRLTALGPKGKPLAMSTVHVMAFASSAEVALAKLESTWIMETPLEIERLMVSIAESAKPN
ncbi:MAG: hypothetical protein V3T05_02900, partial [Myxococcota bacterium]